MYKKIHIDSDEENKFAEGLRYVNDYGTHNAMPNPYHEISLNQAIHDLYITSYSHEDFRQIPFFERGHYRVEETYHNVSIFWGHDHGLAIVYPNHWTLGAKNEIIYPNPVRFFYIGCDHKYRELTPSESSARGVYHAGACYHVYECPECGMITAQDSSG